MNKNIILIAVFSVLLLLSGCDELSGEAFKIVRSYKCEAYQKDFCEAYVAVHSDRDSSCNVRRSETECKIGCYKGLCVRSQQTWDDLLKRGQVLNNQEAPDDSKISFVDESPSAVCGNSIVEGEEECDDGNAVDDDSCSNSCKSVKKGIPDDSAIPIDEEAGSPFVDCGSATCVLGSAEARENFETECNGGVVSESEGYCDAGSGSRGVCMACTPKTVSDCEAEFGKGYFCSTGAVLESKACEKELVAAESNHKCKSSSGFTLSFGVCKKCLSSGSVSDLLDIPVVGGLPGSADSDAKPSAPVDKDYTSTASSSCKSSYGTIYESCIVGDIADAEKDCTDSGGVFYKKSLGSCRSALSKGYCAVCLSKESRSSIPIIGRSVLEAENDFIDCEAELGADFFCTSTDKEFADRCKGQGFRAVTAPNCIRYDGAAGFCATCSG